MIRRALLSSGGVLLLVCVVAVVAAQTTHAAPASLRSVQPAITVRCDEVVLHLNRHDAVGAGYRVVLGVVSAPPAYLPQMGRDPYSAPFSHWLKAGLAIRAGTAAVTVSLPKEWRNRARIVWGAPGSPATALRFAPCPSTVAPWNGYAGGFLLRSNSACVPLVFAVGNRHGTLRFGVGRHC